MIGVIANPPIQETLTRTDRRKLTRRLVVIFLTMLLAQAIGSVFNITYNLVHISPLLTEAQAASFAAAIARYNLTAYPFLLGLWALVVFRLRKPPRDEAELIHRQKRVINLPWWASGIAAAGWLLAIPAILWGLRSPSGTVDAHLWFHLPVSILTAMVISLSLGYLAIDLLRMRLLFPYFFSRTSPARVQGGHGLTVTGRGILLIASSSVCPIIALFMLLVSPSPMSKNLWFAAAVAGAGVGFAICGTLLLRKLVAEPVMELRDAAQAVGEGHKDFSIPNLRADEFGILADEFNTMIAGLREKELVESTLGRHVGKAVARELIRNDDDVRGTERILTVLFSDIRGFTTRSERVDPQDAVRLLNEFHATMTSVIEEHEGIVNSIMGDGFMSLFGAIDDESNHADQAVAAGREMFRRLPDLNARLESLGFEPIEIGAGIHTGAAVIGSIGSPRRLEYTAIGDTVNTASRIESLTKELKSPLLISAATAERLVTEVTRRELPPQPIRGRSQSLILHAIEI